MSKSIPPTGPGTRKKLVTAAKALPIIGVALVLAACSSGNSSSTAAAGGTSNESAKNINIVVIGGTSDDPFFSTVKNGVNAAAKAIEAAGGKVTYLALANYNNLGPDTAKLEATALSLHPSAVAVPDWVPTAQDPNLKAISAAGIPPVIYNSGTLANAKSVGAFTYIGGDYTLSGVAGGNEFVKAGAKNVVFVNTVPGDASSEEFSNGYKQSLTAAGDKYTELNLPASSFGNATAVAQAIKSELLNNPSVDGIATYGTQDADSAASAITQAGASSKVKLMGFNLDKNTLDRIKAGTQLGTIDQLPYPQGFYATSAAFQAAAYGIYISSAPVLTGPAIVDKSNVSKAIAGTAAGTR